jgi:ribosomal protein S18 acetylase RimI-like enzyme
MRCHELAPDDRDAVVALWTMTGLTRPWNDPVADFDRAVLGPTSTIIGIHDDDAGDDRDGDRDLIGTAMVGYDGHRGWAYYVAVHPKRQGEGIGAELMTKAEEWLRRQGAVKVQVMVRHSNEAVTGFYDRLGYQDAEVKVLARWLVDPHSQLAARARR